VAENDVKHEEAIANFKRGKQLETMLQSTGWTEVLKPEIERRKTTHLRVMLDTVEHDTMIRAQQNIRMIDNLIAFISSTIALGKQGGEFIDNEKE
jgi:hypothetical protein